MDPVERIAGLVGTDTGEPLSGLEDARGLGRRPERQPTPNRHGDADARLWHDQQHAFGRELATQRREVEGIRELDLDTLDPELPATAEPDGEVEGRL